MAKRWLRRMAGISFLPLVLEAAVVQVEASGTNPTISVQCGVECLPCIDAGDPYCSGPSPDWPVEDPPLCMYCQSNRPSEGPGAHCESVPDFMTGYPNCTTVYEGSTARSCSASGRFCSAVTVHP